MGMHTARLRRTQRRQAGAAVALLGATLLASVGVQTSTEEPALAANTKLDCAFQFVGPWEDAVDHLKGVAFMQCDSKKGTNNDDKVGAVRLRAKIHRLVGGQITLPIVGTIGAYVPRSVGPWARSLPRDTLRASAAVTATGLCSGGDDDMYVITAEGEGISNDARRVDGFKDTVHSIPKRIDCSDSQFGRRPGGGGWSDSGGGGWGDSNGWGGGFSGPNKMPKRGGGGGW